MGDEANQTDDDGANAIDTSGSKMKVEVESRIDAAQEAGDHEGTDEENEQAEQDRKERLDPENRPVNAEVDNTQRGFDGETSEFKKSGEEVENGPVPGGDLPDDIDLDE